MDTWRSATTGCRLKLVFLGTAAVLYGMLGACSSEPEVVQVDAVETGDVAYGVNEATALGWDDGDRLLGQSEFFALIKRNWSPWNVNGDELLDVQEFGTGWANIGFSDASMAFKSFDGDDDGQLTQAEFQNAQLWDKWDADNDGVLSEKEFPYY